MKDWLLAIFLWLMLLTGVAGFGLALHNALGTTHAPAQSFGSFSPTGGGTYLLQSSISSTQNTITLTSFTEPGSGIPYTMSYIGTDIIYGTIAPSSGNSEFISATGITQNANGTATLTGVVRGESRTPGTGGCVASSTLAHGFSGQTQFILSNTPCFYSEYAALRTNETITGSWSGPAPTVSAQFATKGYVDQVAALGTTSPAISFTGSLSLPGPLNFTGCCGYNMYVNYPANHYPLLLIGDTNGSDLTALGTGAASSTGGANNVAIGGYALYANVNGINNTAVGQTALQDSVDQGNTAIGYTSLNLTTGTYNTALGARSGDALLLGNYNTFLGYGVEGTSTTATRELNIGDLIYGLNTNKTGGSGTPTGGSVGIATSTPLSLFTVAGSEAIGADSNIAAPANGLLVEGIVGIGTSSPQMSLDVASGTLRAYSVSTSTCATANDGAIFYNAKDKHLYVCISTVWTLIK